MVPTLEKVVRKVIDSMELLWDTKIIAQNKNPKGIAEGKCPIFGFNHIANSPMGSGLMYFIPHRCFPIPKLIEIVKGEFDPTTRVVRNLQGKVVRNLDPTFVANAFSPPSPLFPLISLNWDMIPSSNMRISIMSWLNKNVDGAIYFSELPISEVLLSSFSLHLQLLLSMLSIAIGEKSDRYISSIKLAIAFQISYPKIPTIYYWVVASSNGIPKQLVKIDQGSHFVYVSYIVGMLIHQNLSFFKNLTLVKHEGNGSLRFVDRWIEEVRSSINYYSFVENFLVLAMSLVVLEIPRLLKASKLYL